jgi:mono/diheme cytochrome c family protein
MITHIASRPTHNDRARPANLLRPIVLSLGAMLVAGLGIAACGSEDASSDAVGADPNGAALYASNCASCHGADLRGTELGPSHLSIVYEPNHHSDESFRAATSTGAGQHHWNFGDMLPVEGLDDDEIDTIIAFVRAEQEEQGFEPYPP